VPGEPPGYPEGWDEGIHPGHPDYDPGPGERGYRHRASPGGGYYGGDYGPGETGTQGGPYGPEGIYGSLAPPLTLGYGPGSLLSRGWYYGAAGYGAINCCLDYTNPELNVGLAYETDTMSAGEEQTLSVYHADPSCDGDNYEWLITAGGGDLSALSGLEVTYTAPADGHGCPGNTEVTLYCDGVVMAALPITFDYVYVIDFDYDTSAAEIARETSELIYATANNTPLRWSVSGTGFSLEHEETEGFGNVLHADETACGSAEITITGCDDQSATGYVRCTTGQWTAWTRGIKLTGEPDTKTWAGGVLKLDLYKKQGKYKQSQHVHACMATGVAGCDGADCAHPNCTGLEFEQDVCLDWDCSDTYAGTLPVRCEDWCCAKVKCAPGTWPEQEGMCFHNSQIEYAEWIC